MSMASVLSAAGLPKSVVPPLCRLEDASPQPIVVLLILGFIDSDVIANHR